MEKAKIIAKKTEDLIREKAPDFEVREAKVARSSNFEESVETFYRVTNYYKPIDKLLVEMRLRLDSKEHDILSQLASVMFDKDVGDEVFKTVANYYELDLDILKADYQTFQHFKDKFAKYNMTASEIFKKLTETDLHLLLPEFYKALKIYAILPVSSCEAERSFSSLRRLKTYLRSNM